MIIYISIIRKYMKGFSKLMSVKTFDFIIGYENKVRELESVCLLKYELERRGYSVFLFQELDPRYDDVVDIMYHAKVLVVSCGYADNFIESFVRNFITFDKLVNLQWEQVFNKSLEADPDCLINIHGDLCRQAVQIAWGQENIKRHTTLANIPKENIIKTGLMTMDFLNPKFDKLFKSRQEIQKEYNIDSKYEIAILIGVFARAFWTDEQLVKLKEDTGLDLKSEAVTNRQRFDIEMDWIARALRENENLFFIYRPHPGDEYDRCPKDVQKLLDDMVAETGRFIVNQDYTVRQWLKVVDKVYTGYSTTMVDAFFAKKGCRLLSPAGVDMPDIARLFENATETNDYETFEASLHEETYDSPLNIDMIDAYYTVSDELCYPKVADACEKVFNTNSYLIDTSDLRQRMIDASIKKLKGKSFLKRAKLKLWKYDWFYKLYWNFMSLPINNSYFKKQSDYRNRTDIYCKNYVGSPSEIAEITERIKRCLE